MLGKVGNGALVLMSGLDLERLVLSGGPLGSVLPFIGLKSQRKIDDEPKHHASCPRHGFRIYSRAKTVWQTDRNLPINAREARWYVLSLERCFSGWC